MIKDESIRKDHSGISLYLFPVIPLAFGYCASDLCIHVKGTGGGTQSLLGFGPLIHVLLTLVS